MIHYNMLEAKNNFSKIVKLLEEGKQDYVIVTKNEKPLLRITLEKSKDISRRFGIAEGTFNVPDDFDEIDISDDFNEEIYP